MFVKIFTAGHQVPSDATILSFKRVVWRFLRDNSDNGPCESPSDVLRPFGDGLRTGGGAEGAADVSVSLLPTQTS